MLTSLRLDGLVGSDNKKNEIDAADAGQHVFDEPFMAGHVYKGEAHLVRDLQMRKAEIDGNPTLFFFFEAVCIDAR